VKGKKKLVFRDRGRRYNEPGLNPQLVRKTEGDDKSHKRRQRHGKGTLTCCGERAWPQTKRSLNVE